MLSMSRKALAIEITAEERRVLQGVATSRTAPVREAQRARIVLAGARGESNGTIARAVGLHRVMVGKWSRRFAKERLKGLVDRPRMGKPCKYSDTDRLRGIETACTQKPQAETHWSVRSLAEATQVGRETVHRILQSANLKPHRVGTFTQSND